MVREGPELTHLTSKGKVAEYTIRVMIFYVCLKRIVPSVENPKMMRFKIRYVFENTE